MSSSRILADLAIRIGADTAELKKGLGQANKQLTGFQKQMAGIAKGLGAAFAVDLVIDFGKELIQLNKEINKSIKLAKTFTGQAGAALDKTTGKARGLAKTFDKDVQEVLIATNALSKRMGISFDESFTLIEKGFLSGADASGEMLDIVKEYPTIFKEAGINADTFIGLISQQTKDGIFSDKGIDAIHEGILSVREMTKATQEAIEGLGLSGKIMQERIAAGEISLGEAVAEIAKQMGKFEQDSQVVGTAIADIFKGSGEEAGAEFIVNFGREFDKLPDLLDKPLSEFESRLNTINKSIATSSVQLVGGTLSTWFEIKTNEMYAVLLIAAAKLKELGLAPLQLLDPYLTKPATSSTGSTGTQIGSGLSVGGINTGGAQFSIPSFATAGISQVAVPNALSRLTASFNPLGQGATPIVDVSGIVRQINESYDAVYAAFREETSRFSEASAAMVQSVITGSFALIGESIGNALTGMGTGIEGFFNSFITMLTEFGRQFGTILIGLGAAQLALESLGGGNPFVLIAAGTALIALSVAAKNLLTQGPNLPAYASGGLTTGGYAVVGERGPELVSMPTGSRVYSNSQSTNMLAGGQAIEVYGTIKGKDIYLSNKRYSTSKTQTFG